MKKLLCLLLVAVLLFAACSELHEEKTNDYPDEVLMQELDLNPDIQINPLLYFLNESQTKLTPETREIRVPQNHRSESYIVQELINGPESDALKPVAEGFLLKYVEVMPSIINVYLERLERKSLDEVLNTKLAIASSLSDYTGKKYINVFVDEVQAAYVENIPTGVMQKLSSDLNEERLALQSKSEAANPDMSAALYFLDASEQYILPEVRNLVFKDQDYVTTLVEQLIKGPEDTYNHRPVLDKTLKLLGHEPYEDENGNTILRLHFNKEPVAYTERFVDGQQIALAALTYTIESFVPNVHGVEIVVGTMQAGEGVYHAELYRDYVGSSITVYLPGSDAFSMLTGVSRVVAQDVAHHPAAVLEQLMMGPGMTESDVYPAMPDGITMDIVKRVYIAGDIAVIDFEALVDEIMKNVSDDHAFLMTYSIVNTMTSVENVRRVQFLVEGERVEHIGDGRINLIDPLIRNPGIIRN